MLRFEGKSAFPFRNYLIRASIDVISAVTINRRKASLISAKRYTTAVKSINVAGIPSCEQQIPRDEDTRAPFIATIRRETCVRQRSSLVNFATIKRVRGCCLKLHLLTVTQDYVELIGFLSFFGRERKERCVCQFHIFDLDHGRHRAAT